MRRKKNAARGKKNASSQYCQVIPEGLGNAGGVSTKSGGNP